MFIYVYTIINIYKYIYACVCVCVYRYVHYFTLVLLVHHFSFTSTLSSSDYFHGFQVFGYQGESLGTGSIALPPLYQHINYKNNNKKRQFNMFILSPFTISSTFLVKLEGNVQESNQLAFSHDNSILIQKYHSTPDRELSLNFVSYHPPT